MTYWIVGKYKAETEEGAVWDAQGVFDTEEKAKKACIHNNYFIGPMELNELVTDKTIEWEGCYYPNNEGLG